MENFETQSTSSVTAKVTPLVLRDGERTRLVFCPMLIDNPNDNRHCVKGTFVYQKKTQAQEWEAITGTTLSSLKAGEGYQLELKSGELFRLVGELVQLYPFFKQHGIQYGRRRWVRLQNTLAAFLSVGEAELTSFLDSHREGAADSLLRILKWLSTAPRSSEFASKLTQLDPKHLPEINALVGLASIKSALSHWKSNQANNDEEFWQKALAERAFVLSQVFAYPAVIIGQKMYVGGKEITNKGGNVVDFLAQIESTGSVVLIEIKTPQTRLLVNTSYRNDVFPLSTELSGAVAQTLKYRQNFIREYDSLVRGKSAWLLGEPRCFVVAGNTSQLITSAMRESFELQRDRLQGVTILAYDELFARLQSTVSLLEGTDSSLTDDSDADIPF